MASAGRTPIVLALALLMLAIPTAPATETPHRTWSTLATGPYDGFSLGPQEFVTSDGTIISYAVHRPRVAAGDRVPILLTAGPYFALAEEPVHVPSTTRLTGFLVENFVPHGYAVVAASVRGTGWSEGCVELMSAREARDLDELMTFLAGQYWSDGNVAMIGKSYDGTTPWMVAALGNPHLRTIVPIAGVTDLADLLVHRGVAQFRTPYFHAAVYHPYGFGADAFGGGVNEERDAEDRLWNAACPEAAQGLVAGLVAASTGDPAAIEATAAYWRERGWRDAVVDGYEGSVFVVHGLQDWNVVPHTVVPFFTALPQEKKLLLGQWAHQYPDENVFTRRADFALMLKAWFDRHLKGLDVDTGPVVEVADAATGEWRALDAWPLPPVETRAFRLSAPGQLTTDAEWVPFRQTIATPAGATVYDRPCSFSNAATFTSMPVERAFRVSGLPTLNVTLDPATPGAVVAVLCADGRVIAHGATSTLYADGGPKPRPFLPSAPLEVEIAFEPVEHTIRQHARLTLGILMDDAVGDRSGAGYLPGAGAGVAAVTAGTLRLPVS